MTTSETTESLIDPTFLAVLLAKNTDRTGEIKELLRSFIDLKKYGWTDDEILIATETGYSYAAHLGSWSRWNWKWQANAKPMYDWLRHYYYQLRADQGGMNLEEFIAEWRTFVKRGHGESLHRMKLFCRARKYGIAAEKAKQIIWRHDHREAEICFELMRRGVSSDTVSMIMSAMTRDRFIEISNNLKYLIEAYRRGADRKQLRTAINDQTLSKLALTLRREMRGAA